MLIFKLRRTTFGTLIALFGVAGILTFSAGMITGVRWTLNHADLVPASEVARLAEQSPEGTTLRVAPMESSPSTAPESSTVPKSVTGPTVRKPTVQKPTVRPPTVRGPSVSGGSASAGSVSTGSVSTGSVSTGSVSTGSLSTGSIPSPTAAPVADGAMDTTTDTAVAPAPSEDLYSLQVGAFLRGENTQKLFDELTSLGLEPSIVKKRASGDRILETVRVGRYPNRQQAEAMQDELKAVQGLESAIVRINP